MFGGEPYLAAQRLEDILNARAERFEHGNPWRRGRPCRGAPYGPSLPRQTQTLILGRVRRVGQVGRVGAARLSSSPAPSPYPPTLTIVCGPACPSWSSDTCASN